MNRKSFVLDLGASPRELIGFLAYVFSLTMVLGHGFAWSVRFPEIALRVLPFVCLAILWDDRRREDARLTASLSSIDDEVMVLDPLWDREFDS